MRDRIQVGKFLISNERDGPSSGCIRVEGSDYGSPCGTVKFHYNPMKHLVKILPLAQVTITFGYLAGGLNGLDMGFCTFFISSGYLACHLGLKNFGYNGKEAMEKAVRWAQEETEMLEGFKIMAELEAGEIE